jgi:hypothetical protein
VFFFSSARYQVPSSGLIQPLPSRRVEAAQPKPKAVTKRAARLGPNQVACRMCDHPCKNARGLQIHLRSAHPAVDTGLEDEAKDEAKHGSPDVSEAEYDPGVNSDGEQLFEVDSIADSRQVGRHKEYLVYWKPRTKWPDPTWEAVSTLDCPKLISDFNRRNNKSNKK